MNLLVHRLIVVCFAVMFFIFPFWFVARSDNETPRRSSLAQQEVPPKPAKKQREILPPYGFTEITPAGKWHAAADFDISQTHDPDVPVVIVAMSSYAGKGAWAKQFMVDEVTIKNNSSNPIKSVRLGWIILNDADRTAGKNRRAALREGFTNDISKSIEPGQMRKLRNLHIDFVKEAGDLIRSGKINGLAFVRLRVSEVTFENDSNWKEGAAIARRHHAVTSPTSPSQALCPNIICLFHENGQGYCEGWGPGFWCRREDCSPDDPNACFCRILDCSTCQDQDNDGEYDCEGDCNDHDPTISSLALEFSPSSNCTDGKDNDCDPDTAKDCGSLPCMDLAACSPTPTPTPPPGNGQCGSAPNWGSYPSTGCASGFTVLGGVCTRSQTFQNRCAGPSYYDPVTCTCPDGTDPSPIVVDVDRSGFLITSAARGVVFNILNDGVPLKLSWTTTDSSNAWLTLDRNNNGKIDNGTELFGDVTPQPSSPHPNGFIALAEYDKTAMGGNGDGRIDAKDAIFTRLRLWQDFNHNGRSESEEMHSLPELGVAGIDLDFKESKWTDDNGNHFRYRAKVYASHGVKTDRWAWDVFLKPGL